MNWGGSTYPYSFTPTSAGTPYGAGTGTIVATPTTAGLTAAQIAAIQPLNVTVTNVFGGSMSGIRDRTNNQSPYVQNMQVSTFNASGWGEPGLSMAQTGGTSTNAYQAVTISFDRAVTSLAFAIGDIDSSSNNHNDRVTLSSGTTDHVHTTVSRGSSLYGTGRGTTDGSTQTAPGPYRPSGSNGLQDDETGMGGNVSLSYANSITSVTVKFWNASTSGGRQWIFLKNVTFYASTCK